MPVTDSTYYGLTKTREMSPDARDWAATDFNFELLSLILKAFEGHHHDAGVPINYPGYYTQPAAPTISNQGTAGTTTYSYYVVANGLVPVRISAIATTNTGNATLNGTNFNRLTWAAVGGATSYDVVRVTGGTTQGRIAATLGATTFDDTGVAATAFTPVRQPTLSELTTGGVLTPGTSLGVRLSYLNTLGLETEACTENVITLSAAASRPLSPLFTSSAVAANALPGGTYLYVLTKTKGSGETVISDPLPVDIAYDNTYSVTISFDAINTYTDGTTGINIYRTAGLSSSFQLIGQISTTSQTSFTDTNTISPSFINVQPPTKTTFDASKKVRIDWSALTHPVGASKLRVYVTQQTGLWGQDALLTEIDLTGTPVNYVDYLGSETLLPGWPKNVTQIPASPPKIDLATEVTQSNWLTLTNHINFVGNQALNLRLHNNGGAPGGTITNGYIYYDTSINTVRAYINGAWVNWGTTTASAYSHPAEEAGGHIAANIKFKASSAVTAKDIFDTMRDTNGLRKNATTLAKVVGAAQVNGFTATTPTLLTDMTMTRTPDFDNQWFEAVFGGHFQGNTLGMTISAGIEFDGVLQEETVRSMTIPFNNSNVSIQTVLTMQFGLVSAGAKVIRVLWWVDTGTAKAWTTRRTLAFKGLF